MGSYHWWCRVNNKNGSLLFPRRFGINLQNMELIKPYVRNEWDDLKIIVGTTKKVILPTVGDKCLHSID